MDVQYSNAVVAGSASGPAPAAASPPLPPVDSRPVEVAPSAAGDRRAVLAHPEALHPTLWLGHQLGQQALSAGSGVGTGFALLDEQLPGGGWPRRALSELLLPHPGIGEVRLLAPSLVAAQRAGRLVMLFDPPTALSAVALIGLGFDLEELLVIQTRARVIPGTDSLWALEQALKSGHVGAVVAWLPPRLRPERLRRLQLAAHAHDGPAFVLRDVDAVQRPTAAPLRLGLRSAGADLLAVQILKRRGPPLEAPIRLALPPVLSPPAQARAASLAERAAVRTRAARVGASGRAGGGSGTGTGTGSRGGLPAEMSASGKGPGATDGGTGRDLGSRSAGEGSGKQCPPDGLPSATFINLG